MTTKKKSEPVLEVLERIAELLRVSLVTQTNMCTHCQGSGTVRYVGNPNHDSVCDSCKEARDLLGM